MKPLNSFLLKLEHFLPLETRVRMILIPFLESEYHIKLNRKSIKVQREIIFLDVEPVVRVRILQKKQILLAELHTKGIQEIMNIQ